MPDKKNKKKGCRGKGGSGCGQQHRRGQCNGQRQCNGQGRGQGRGQGGSVQNDIDTMDKD